MRAREFTINVPIKININGDEDPEISVDGQQDDEEEFDQNPVMMNPQQQELELRKAELGKKSPSIDKLIDDDEDIGNEEEAEAREDNTVGAGNTVRNVWR